MDADPTLDRWLEQRFHRSTHGGNGAHSPSLDRVQPRQSRDEPELDEIMPTDSVPEIGPFRGAMQQGGTAGYASSPWSSTGHVPTSSPENRDASQAPWESANPQMPLPPGTWHAIPQPPPRQNAIPQSSDWRARTPSPENRYFYEQGMPFDYGEPSTGPPSISAVPPPVWVMPQAFAPTPAGPPGAWAWLPVYTNAMPQNALAPPAVSGSAMLQNSADMQAHSASARVFHDLAGGRSPGQGSQRVADIRPSAHSSSAAQFHPWSPQFPPSLAARRAEGREAAPAGRGQAALNRAALNRMREIEAEAMREIEAEADWNGLSTAQMATAAAYAAEAAAEFGATAAADRRRDRRRNRRNRRNGLNADPDGVQNSAAAPQHSMPRRIGDPVRDSLQRNNDFTRIQRENLHHSLMASSSEYRLQQAFRQGDSLPTLHRVTRRASAALAEAVDRLNLHTSLRDERFFPQTEEDAEFQAALLASVLDSLHPSALGLPLSLRRRSQEQRGVDRETLESTTSVETFRQASFGGAEFTVHTGCVSMDHVIFQEEMTIDEAKVTCSNLPGCVGFSFEGKPSSLPVLVYFINEWSLKRGAWTSFRKEEQEGTTDAPREIVLTCDQTCSTNDLGVGWEIPDWEWQEDGCWLSITSINEGLVKDWNDANHPSWHVRIGDHILEVNGVSGLVSDLVRECESRQLLQMKCLLHKSEGDIVTDADDSAERHAQEPCAICLEGFEEGEELRVLPCKHRFHRACVDQWMLSRNKCPLCRHKPGDELNRTSRVLTDI